MEKIAFISGGTFIYWSSIILALAVVTAICFYVATYLARGGNTTGMALAVPMIALLGIVLGRFVHWYSRTDAYSSFGEAMTNFSSGGFALMGAFWAALLTVGILRLLRLIPSAGKMLDALAIGGGAGIAVGRLGSLFNASDRGVVLPETVSFPFASPVVNDVSGLVENRLATFMIQSMVTAFIVAALIVFMLVSHLRKKRIKDGDVCLLFLLAYGALQIVCDSTRYDSLFLRSNGFISIVQIMGLVAMVIPLVFFSIRMVKVRGFKVWYLAIWLGGAALFGLGGYMEYHVQRHGDQAAFAYSVMSTCLVILIGLGILIRYLGSPWRKIKAMNREK